MCFTVGLIILSRKNVDLKDQYLKVFNVGFLLGEFKITVYECKGKITHTIISNNENDSSTSMNRHNSLYIF